MTDAEIVKQTHPSAVVIALSAGETAWSWSWHVVESPAWPLRHLGTGADAGAAWRDAAKHLKEAESCR